MLNNYYIYIRQYIKSLTLLRSTLIYVISKIFTSLIPFLLLPILTKFLTPNDYGIITMFTTVIALSVPILTLNFDSAIQRSYFYNDIVMSKYIGTCFVVLLVYSLLSIILLVPFVNHVSRFTEIPVVFLLLIPLYALSKFLTQSYLSILQVKEKPISYGVFQISQTIVEISFALVLIVILHFGWDGRATSIIVSSIFFSIVSFILFTKNNLIVFSFKFEYLKHAFKFGSGLIPHALGGSLLLFSNRFFMTNMVNIEETGFYGVANQVGSVISFLTIAFNNAYVPYLFKILSKNSEHEKRKLVKNTYVYLVVLLFIVFIFYLFVPFIFKVFIDESFQESYKYVIWIVIGYFFQGAYFMVTNYILFAEKTLVLAISTLSLGLLNIPLNFLLISWLGPKGAAMSFALIFFLFFIVTWIISNKVMPMPWRLRKLS